MKDDFTGYRILGWYFFFLSQHFKYFTSTLYDFQGEIGCNSYLCSSIGKVFFFLLASFWIFTLSFILCSMKMICLLKYFSYLVFSEFPGSVIRRLTVTWGNSQSLFFQIVLFLSFFLLLLVFLLCIYYTFCSCPIIVGYLFFFFFSLWSLCFSVFEDSIGICFSSEILFSVTSSLLISHQRHSSFHIYIYIYIWLINNNNVVIVSGAQQSKSAIHIHVSILLQTPLQAAT